MTSSYNTIIGTDTANTLIGSTGSDSFAALAGDDIVLGAGNNFDDQGILCHFIREKARHFFINISVQQVDL